MQIGRYNFEGPYGTTDQLQDRSGVYVVLSLNGNQYGVIDIGESATVKTRISNHDRQPCWRGSATGPLSVAVLYTPNEQQSGRMTIEQELRAQFNPPCGQR